MKIRITLAAVAGVAALTAAGVTSAAASTSPPAPPAPVVYAPPASTMYGLSVGFHGYQVKWGYRGFLVTLTNTTNHSITVKGYVGLKLLDQAGKPMPTKTIWGSTAFAKDPGPALIVLSPGETASADIGFVTVGHFPAGWNFPSRSFGAKATYLEVTAPYFFGSTILRIPGAPVQVWFNRMYVTALAYHTPYGPSFPWITH